MGSRPLAVSSICARSHITFDAPLTADGDCLARVFAKETTAVPHEDRKCARPAELKRLLTRAARKAVATPAATYRAATVRGWSPQPHLARLLTRAARRPIAVLTALPFKSRLFLGSATVLLAGVTHLTIAQGPVITSQYGTARTGANLNESTLTPRNVNAGQFGKVGAYPVDGPVYAQPLFLPAVTVPGKGVHDIVFIATEHDSVYAFDAQATGAAEPLWHVSFVSPNVSPVPAHDVECPLISPEVGITSTPTIDIETGTLYVLARTKEHKGPLGDQYVQKLHALAVTTGVEKFGGPVAIHAYTMGHGAGNSHGAILFDPRRQNPRAAVLLLHGKVYLTWASSCDAGPYHGWVMAYDAHTLKQQAVFNTSPDANDAGIWLSDTGPAADGDGNIYMPTGNGRFDLADGGHDYGDSVLKLRMDGGKLTRERARPGTQILSDRLLVGALESSRVAEYLAAVDHHDVAGDPARLVRYQEGDRSRDVGRFADASQRGPRRHELFVVLPQRLGKPGANHARADRIHPDSR